MELYTIQLAKWRSCPSDIELIDTTVKSGELIFAPSKDIVNGIKYKGLSEEDYIKEYYRLMRISFKNNKERWLEVLSKDKIAIACYCRKDKFCHRFLLKDIFLKIGLKHHIDIEYSGELK